MKRRKKFTWEIICVCVGVGGSCAPAMETCHRAERWQIWKMSPVCAPYSVCFQFSSRLPGITQTHMLVPNHGQNRFMGNHRDSSLTCHSTLHLAHKTTLISLFLVSFHFSCCQLCLPPPPHLTRSWAQGPGGRWSDRCELSRENPDSKREKSDDCLWQSRVKIWAFSWVILL